MHNATSGGRVSGYSMAALFLGLALLAGLILISSQVAAARTPTVTAQEDGEKHGDFLVRGNAESGSISPTGIGGGQHWAVLMCKFSDVAAEPQTGDFFEEMFSRDSGPSLEDYWREASYNNITNLSAEAFGWFELPHDRAYYDYSETEGGFEINTLIQDCIFAADPSVDFSNFDAVSVMLNSPSPLAGATLGFMIYPDGAMITLGALAIPSNKHNLALMAHEMGHAYGLPHSSANGQEYANPWDLMGIASSYRCGVNEDPTYSCLGQHPISAFKAHLGWITGDQIFYAPQGTSQVTLERLAQPQTDNPLMARVDAGGVFYTVEARKRVGYDAKLAGDAVIIHRNGTDLVDADGAAPYDDDGAMWLPGETFSDEVNDVEITVESATATGFNLSITLGDGAEPAVNLISSSVSPPVANAGDRIEFEWQLNYEDGAAGAVGGHFTFTHPTGITYMPGSVEIEGLYATRIVSEDPLAIAVDDLSGDPLTIRYATMVDAAMTDPTWLTIGLEADWQGGSSQFETWLLINGYHIYLPVITRAP